MSQPVAPDVASEITAAIRILAGEAIRDALLELASGSALSPEEGLLLERYRTAGETHRQAALRTLERGQPPQEKQP